jgi:hypothetical protein
LHLPFKAYCEDFHGSASKGIKKYLKDDNNAKRFFDFAKRRFPETDIKDIILVTGYSVVTSWAAAVFLERNVRAQLASEPLPEAQVNLQWQVEGNNVLHHASIPSQVRCLGPPRQPDKY